MSTQDKPITTPAAMRAAEKIAEIPHICLEFGDGYEASTDVIPVNEIATIIDQQTHLPELVEAVERYVRAVSQFELAETISSREKLDQAAQHRFESEAELRSVLERVKGEK